MTERATIIEVMARAICDAEDHGAQSARSCVKLGPLCRQGSIGAKCDAFKSASFALTALQASGMAVVPREPTPEILIAALSRSIEWMKENGVDGLSPFSEYPSPTETIRQVYRAIIAVADDGKSERPPGSAKAPLGP